MQPATVSHSYIQAKLLITNEANQEVHTINNHQPTDADGAAAQ